MGRTFSITATGGAARAACAAAAALLTLSACYEKEKLVSNWDQLCAIADCETYPLNTTTVEMGGVRYYFPKGQYYAWPSGKRYVDVDSKGSWRRGVYLNSPGMQLSPCCSSLLEALGEPDSPGPYAVDIRVEKNASYFDTEHPIDRLVPDGDFSRLPEWNGDFYLLEQLPVHEEGFLPVRLISKRQLLFGARLYVDCKLSCDAELFGGPADRLVVELVGVTPPVSVKHCDGAKGPCQTRNELIAQIPERLRTIEHVLDRLRIPPKLAGGRQPS